MKNKFLLLVAAIAISTSGLFAANLNTNQANTITKYAGVATKITCEDVYRYLADNGIEAVQIWQIAGSENFGALDVKGLHWIVYVENGVIITHEEVDF